jgi:hypothetical protein
MVEEGYMTEAEHELHQFRDAILSSGPRHVAESVLKKTWAGWGQVSAAARSQIVTVVLLYLTNDVLDREARTLPLPTDEEIRDRAEAVGKVFSEAIRTMKMEERDLTPLQLNTFSFEMASALRTLGQRNWSGKQSVRVNDAIDVVASIPNDTLLASPRSRRPKVE